MPFSLGVVWAVLCTDALQGLEYKTRPYEVVAGANRSRRAGKRRYLCEVFRNRPHKGKKWGALVWHLTTDYFLAAMREVFRKFEAIEVDRLRVKPVVKITGEFYLQTVEGDPNYNIHRWLEAEGAEVYPAPIVVWLDYWFRFDGQQLEDYVGIDRTARLKLAKIRTCRRYSAGPTTACARARRYPARDAGPVRAAPARRTLLPHQLSGGEGDMLVGKALWAICTRRRT